MKCSFCGHELEPGAGFCPNCNTIISLDNEFVSPKQPDLPAEPAAAPEPTPAAAETPPAVDPALEESLGGMPEYVSPTFDAYQPAQTVPEAPQTPEDDDDDPFREMHPDLDDTPPAPPVVPADAQISDAESVAADGDIPVYEPTEEPAEDDEQMQEETDGDDDMYVSGGKSKKGVVVALLVVLLLAAAAVGAWYYVKTQNPFLQPTATTEDTSAATDSTLPVSGSDADTTENTTEDSTADSTEDSTTDEDTTDESTSEDDATAISADENELTAPQDTSATTVPTTDGTTTTQRATTTTQRATTTTQRATTTTQRATTTTQRATTTTRRTTTTTRPTTRPTTQPTTTQTANTLQRPTSTFAARTMYVSVNGVALRYAPRSDSGNRVSLSVGADVSVTAEQNGYYYVYSNRYGVSGWVSKRYLGTSRPVAQTQQTVSGVVQPDVTVNGGTKTVNSGSSLNLRKGPGTEYDVIRAISDGYPVAVKGRSSSVSGWVYVTDITRGVSGWVSETYLK